ncbi:MAG TPA: agglutinin biogenesis protein MshI [Burkholderiaceae bacterium]
MRWVCTESWVDPTQTLRTLRGTHQLKRWPLMALMERGRYQLTQLEAPNSPREDWRQASRWQLQERVDFPVDSAAIDVLEIPGNAASGRRPHLLAAVAARDAVLPLLNASTEARLRLDVLDVPETALRNISALLEADGGAQALLHVGEHSSSLVITQGGELLLTRQLDRDGSDLSNPDPELRQQAFERAGLDLQRTLDGFERSHTQVALTRLLVAPGQALPDFLGYIRELLYVPVVPLEPGERLDLSAVPELARDPRVLSRYLCAIGAALRPRAD